MLGAALALIAAATPAHALCGDGGQVCFVAVANTAFEKYTAAPTPTEAAWMRSHYRRMLVYSPSFDTGLSWFPDGWAYKDTYAIYTDSELVTQHPEWILRDAAGNRLYIPHDCSGGTCAQFAGDIGNPAFRANWIREATAMLAAGYRGLVEDDFNMRLQVGDGNGDLVTPVDPRTGTLMTVADWMRYLVQFQREIRAAFPDKELVENQVWFFAPPDDPAVVAATRDADYVWIERGFNDAAIAGGTGEYGFETLLDFIDAAHRDGVGVVLEPGWAGWGRDYALATYFLFSNGADAFSSRDGGVPDDWWTGYDVDLGSPLNDSYRWYGLFRRDFARGCVLVNQPDSPTVTVTLGMAMVGLDGLTHTAVTLPATTGIVLRTPVLPLPPPPPPAAVCTTVRCALDATMAGPACAGQDIPAAVVKRLDRAAAIVDGAAGGPARRQRRLLRRVKHAIEHGLSKATRAAARRHAKLSPECVTALRGFVEDALVPGRS